LAKQGVSLKIILCITVDQQMVGIVLIRQIWRVEKIAKLKQCHHYPFHCKTYDYAKFLNFEQQICQIKPSPSCPDCQIG
jgi:hypothetical protein